MVTIKMKKDNLIVTVRGDLDLVIAKEFREAVDKMLVDRPVKNLILDLSQVGFIDSSGLGVILGRYKMLQQKNAKMSIIGANPAVCRILDLSGILKIIPVITSEEFLENKEEGLK